MSRFPPITVAFRRLRYSVIFLVSAAVLAASVGPAGAAEIDHDWIAKLPGGDKIKIHGELKQSGSTARGKAEIDGKLVEIAAGTLKKGSGSGKVLMWRLDNGFKLSSIHPDLDVFPLNEITLPDSLMVLAHGDFVDTKVDLPGELKTFAEKVLHKTYLISLKPGLNLYGRLDPKDLPKNTRKAFKTFGIHQHTILLGGHIGNILMKKPDPALDMYAELPPISMPGVLEKVFSGSNDPILFLGASPKSGEIRFGVSDKVKMHFGDDIDFNFNVFFLMFEEDGKIGIKAMLTGSDWNKAFGIKGLTMSDLKGVVGVTPTGSLSFELAGSMHLKKRRSSPWPSARASRRPACPIPARCCSCSRPGSSTWSSTWMWRTSSSGISAGNTIHSPSWRATRDSINP